MFAHQTAQALALRAQHQDRGRPLLQHFGQVVRGLAGADVSLRPHPHRLRHGDGGRPTLLIGTQPRPRSHDSMY